MNKLKIEKVKHCCTALGRLHRSHGHGIHSPFAFKFVLQVLCEHSCYYAYEDIRKLRRRTETAQRKAGGKLPKIVSEDTARMLFRLVNYYNPQKILQIGGCFGVTETVMNMVSSTSEVAVHEPQPELFDLPGTPDRVSRYKNLDDMLQKYAAVENPFVLINHIDEADYDRVCSYVAEVQAKGGVLILRNLSRRTEMGKLWERILHSGEFGMGFSNDKFAVLAANPKLPRQNYSLWF